MLLVGRPLFFGVSGPLFCVDCDGDWSVVCVAIEIDQKAIFSTE